MITHRHPSRKSPLRTAAQPQLVQGYPSPIYGFHEAQQPFAGLRSHGPSGGIALSSAVNLNVSSVEFVHGNPLAGTILDHAPLKRSPLMGKSHAARLGCACGAFGPHRWKDDCGDGRHASEGKAADQFENFDVNFLSPGESLSVDRDGQEIPFRPIPNSAPRADVGPVSIVLAVHECGRTLAVGEVILRASDAVGNFISDRSFGADDLGNSLGHFPSPQSSQHRLERENVWLRRNCQGEKSV